MKSKVALFLLVTGMLFLLTSKLSLSINESILLFLSGLGFMIISFVIIIVSKRQIVYKLCAIGSGLVFLILLIVFNSLLVKSSYLIYFTIHQKDVEQINKIALTKKEFFSGGENLSKQDYELNQLQEIQKRLGIHYIIKTSDNIFYDISHLLNKRVGIAYSLNGKPPHIYAGGIFQGKRLVGNWYY
jgi:ABC-type transport system involved in multi-copper enzyme maturation permease subunit